MDRGAAGVVPPVATLNFVSTVALNGVSEVAPMTVLPEKVAQIVRERLAGLPRPVTLHVFTRQDRLIIPGQDPSPGVRETVQLMEEVAGLAETVRVEVHDMNAEPALSQRYGVERAPAIVPVADDGSEDGVDYGIRFYGPPAGYEFGSLLEAIQAVAAGSVDLPPQVVDTLARVDQPVHLRIFSTPT